MQTNIITIYDKKRTICFIITALILLALIFCGSPVCEAAGTQLVWDESPDSTVAGYYIYYGTESGNYDTNARVQVIGKSTTNYLIADLNLTPGQTYYIATTAYTDTEEVSSYSNEVIYEEAQPETVTNLQSTTHTIGACSSYREITLEWTAAVDNGGSGLDGYSIVWDTASDTLPDTTKDIEDVTTITSSTLSDEAYYFHIRSVDKALNWNDTAAHLGPFCISSEEVIVDNGNAGASSTGSWSVSGGASPYGDTSLYSKAAGATYTFEASVDGRYAVSLWWTEWASRCTSVPVAIYDGDTLIDTIRVNQQVNGEQWNVLGTYIFSGAARVVITAESADYSTCADAVKFVSGADDMEVPSATNVTISGNTIETTYSEPVENATTEANYRFSPSLNFATAGNDITNLGNNTYRLTMASIAPYAIYTLTIGDGITDAAGNPVSPNQITINDGDDDDMADDWEFAKGVTNPNADPDNDGLTNVQECENDTEPEISDTDNDGLSDGYEVTYGLDPAGNDDANDDPDSDGYTNYQEYLASSNPLDADSTPAPPSIAVPHPHHQAGIKDDTLIPTNTSFSVVLSDPCGFDLTEGGCVLFTITMEGYASYDRTLSNSSLRWVKKIDQDEPDTMVTKLWVVYDISTDSVPEIDDIDHAYPFGKTVAFEVFVQNRLGISASETYTIKIEAVEQHDEALACQPPIVVTADSVTVSGGTACDAKIIFNPEEPVTPSFGSSEGLPALDSVVSDVVPVGGALNLLPPTVFNQPVTISIPCPGVVDTSTLNIYYYTGETWILACDSAGDIKTDAEDWMVFGSRQNFNEEIKIQVYHFSGVQAAIILPSGSSGDSVVRVSDSGSSSGGGCFIATAAFGSYMEPHVQLLRDFRDLHLLNNKPGRWFVRTYYRYGPIAAHYIINNPYWKPVVRVALMPLVGVSYILVKTSGEIKMLITILMICCVISLIVRNKLITENRMVKN